MRRHNGEVAGRIVDVGSMGIGSILPQVIEPGEHVTLMMETVVGNVEAEAEAKYCRQLEDSPNYRIGFEFKKMGRLQSPKWARLIEQGA